MNISSTQWHLRNFANEPIEILKEHKGEGVRQQQK